jgi:hypothetical protein
LKVPDCPWCSSIGGEQEEQPPYSQENRKNSALEINPEWQAAINAVESGESVFITGAAGTGKSTLLGYIRDKIKSQYAVVAPTGVAALNVGGQTIHSFFKFPPAYISPESITGNDSVLFQKLGTLIIDEISMVRADVLEGIHLHLSRSRGNAKPFGGVQVVLFGDPYQLPPVVHHDELHTFRAQYGGPYFFNAPVFQLLKPTVITLSKNYRQQNEDFLRLLWKVRTGTITDDELAVLNERCVPISPFDESYVHLTSTNNAAGMRNQSFLNRISAEKHTYTARIIGQFSESTYPTDEVLELKIGAKIMMVKNDRWGRWVNGTIGKVAALAEDDLSVEIDGQVHTVEREQWDKLRYRYNSYERRVIQEVVASFVQFPLRLAWAITIHKSQGHTLQKVYIDLGDGAFAHGQTYVALSRCTSLEGIVLEQPLRRNDIIIDQLILDAEKADPSMSQEMPSGNSNKGEALIRAVVTGGVVVEPKQEMIKECCLQTQKAPSEAPSRFMGLTPSIREWQRNPYLDDYLRTLKERLGEAAFERWRQTGEFL